MENVQIYFGTASDNLYPYHENPQKGFIELIRRQGLQSLVVSHQKHGIAVRIITEQDEVKKPLDFFNTEGDILITNQPNIAIGVITADCTPVLLYDPEHELIAAVHAGWKGTLAGATEQALELMHHQFETSFDKVTASIGPAGQVCCYEVGPEFLDMFGYGSLDNQTLVERHEKWYCDVPLMNKIQLLQSGVKPENITQSTVCTLCAPGYFSHRRQKEAAGRQISFIQLL
jgi:polyphenol oxidase